MRWRLVILLAGTATATQTVSYFLIYDPDPDTFLWVELIGIAVVAGLVFTGFAMVGAWSTSRIALHAPWFEAFAYGTRRPRPAALLRSSLEGALLALALQFLMAVAIFDGVPKVRPEFLEPIGVRIVTSINAGITEQLMVSYAILSLVARTLTRTAGACGVEPTVTTMRIAIALASLLFALIHLEFDLVTMIDRFVIGCVFGWAYWRHGLESAMVIHTLYDTVILLIYPYWV